MSKYIGARRLTSIEAKLILPTYDEIFEQIEEIRTSAADLGGNADIQKTNNIGILGCRGAGKTSILKTIANSLKEDKEKNIILPIIIPENMSASSTLMATVLGLFKTIVEDIEKKEKSNNKNCICESDKSLSKKYIEVIKQYTFIQKEYRDILINEFTSENEYVKKSKEVFNSDIEFINKFNEFIDKLIEKKGNDALVFLFIDDIDLSTRRCTDVVKTLLSYVCHKNIVTFISGDLDTFEEALTIDFLRQEEALSDQVWNGSFLGSGETLLENKKRLAYECLKKVIPPIYRYNIKNWSLENRADYVINPDANDHNPNLSELLTKVLKEYINPSYFKFINYTDSEEGKEENLIYPYHIFDHTSRGLNNVYNVLLSIYQKNEGMSFEEKKMLIETIASSKEIYNRYRKELFENIISFGSNEESTYIRFGNFKTLIDKVDETSAGSTKGKSRNNRNDEKDEVIVKNTKVGKGAMNEIEKFQMFVLVDFSARLLSTEKKKFDMDNMGNDYNEVKKNIVEILIQNPSISGSNYKLKKPFKLDMIGQNKSYLECTYKNVISSFLVKGDFDLSMSVYNNLTSESYEIYEYEDDETPGSKAEFRKCLWYIYKAIKSCSYLQEKEIKKYISDIYEVFNVEFGHIQNNLSDNKLINLIMSIYSGLVSNYTVGNKDSVKADIEGQWNEYAINYKDTGLSPQYIDKIVDQNIRRLYYNTLSKSFGNKLLNSNGEIVQLERDKSGTKKIENIIYNINKNDLWGHSITKTIKDNLKKKIDEEFTNNRDVNIVDIQNIEKSYSDFEKIYKGRSKTKAKRVEDILEKILKDKEANPDKEIDFVNFCFIREIVRRLAINNRVVYGQYEAQSMLNDLNETTLISEYMKDEQFQKYLYYYALFISKDLEMQNVYRQSRDLSEFKKEISSSQGEVSNNMIKDYMKLINEGSKESISIEDLDNLF